MKMDELDNMLLTALKNFFEGKSKQKESDRKTIEDLSRRILKLENQLEEEKVDKVNLQKQLTSLTHQVQELTNEHDTLTNEHRNLKIEFKMVRNKVSPPQLQYKPVSEQDEKAEYGDYKVYPTPNNGVNKTPDGNFKIIGAKVRGRNHKDEGTPCDDWFECDTSGNWTIVAVADGAGSKTKSRVGAEIACKAAIQYLSKKLQQYDNLGKKKYEDVTMAHIKSFIENQLKQFFSEALEKSSEAIRAKAKTETIEPSEFSTTILLAIHSKIARVRDTHGDIWENFDFVCSCNVGDGMIGTVSETRELKAKRLSTADRGSHSGETKFLTSSSYQSDLHIDYFLGKMKTLMIMTDGISEDYTEDEKGILTLYGDLILNGIIGDFNQSSETNFNTITSNMRRKVNSNKDKFQFLEERILPQSSSETKEVNIAYMDRYREVLGQEITEILNSKDLLASDKITGDHNTQSIAPQEKLKIWLDSYRRQGSGDDRTLVVIYQEEV